MGHIDLHVHTTYSDGTLTPEALVAEAAARGVTLLAITDHDELGGVLPAQAVGAALGIEVLSGVEINTDLGREDVHILGYGFPPDSPLLQEGLQQLRTSRLERMYRVLERLSALKLPLDSQRVLAIAGHGSVGRPHIARALVEAGYVANMSEAFSRLLGNHAPAYVTRLTIAPEEAIALLHRAGGLAVLAHPGKLGDPPRILRRLLDSGLDGLEAYHSDHSSVVTQRMLKLAERYKLLVTGGTDSHGPGGPHMTPPGAVPVPAEIGELLLAALCKRV